MSQTDETRVDGTAGGALISAMSIDGIIYCSQCYFGKPVF